MSAEQYHCHCGQPLHYRTPHLEACMTRMVEAYGTMVHITDSLGQTWRVPRHYIALHGITEQDLATLGFERLPSRM